MRPRRAFFSCLVALLALLTAGAALAASPPTPAIVDLIVNATAAREITVLLADGDILVRESDLAAAGLNLPPARPGDLPPAGSDLDPAGRKLPAPPPGQAGAVGLRSLGALAPDLTYVFDEPGLALRVTAPAAWFSPGDLVLGLARPRDLVIRTDTSAFANYSFTLLDGTHVSSFDEAGVSVAGKLLYTSAVARTDAGVARMLTNLSWDDRASLRRVVIGDALVNGGPLGSGRYVGGITISRNFDADPYLVHTPTLGFAGAVSTPATLDVYVDGRLVRRVDLAPGTFQARNLPAQTGAGDVRYVVRDAFGNETSFASPYYLAEGLLAEGLHEYTYSVGLAREELGVKSFSYDAPGLVARHRVGLTRAFTLGARLEVAADRVSTGPTWTLGAPVGQLDLGLAASLTTRGTPGGAAYLAWSYRGRLASASASVQAMTRHYTTLSLGSDDDRPLAIGGASMGVALGPRVSVTAQQTFSVDRDAGWLARSSVNTSVRAAQSLGLTLTAGRSAVEGQPPALDVFAMATYVFGGAVTASAGASAAGGKREALLAVNRALPAGNGAGGHVSAALGDSNQVDAAVAAQSPYGRYEARYLRLDAEQHLSVQASGGLVWVHGGGVHLTRPVEQGFGVVELPGAAGVRVTLDNQVVGRTGSDGRAAIPNLLPYYANRLGFADVDLPMDYDVRATELPVAPTYRGGILVAFPVRRTRFVRGHLVIRRPARRGVPASETIPKYGELRVSVPAPAAGAAVTGDAPGVSAIGAAGEFELEGIDPGPHPAEILHAGGRCRFRLGIPGGHTPVVDVGLVVCVEAP